MSRHGRTNGLSAVWAVSLMMFAVALLLPLSANAQVSISHVKVTVSSAAKTATYCDTNTVCTSPIWTLPGGSDGFRFLLLNPGNTGVLTQTDFAIPGNANSGSNFDSSDRNDKNGTVDCGGALSPPIDGICTVTVQVDTGSGFNAGETYSSAAGDPLNNFNKDSGQPNHNEASPYGSAVISKTQYTTKLGYADNVHPNAANCPATGCFPNPFDGSGGTQPATVFVGKGLTGCAVGSNCYDSGALLFTAGTQPGNFVTVTQGGWGSAPHGNNPGQFLVDNFASTFGAAGVTIGCSNPKFHLTFDKPSAIQAFLPQGGTPGVLDASALDPTTSAAGVFAGQVLALQLNVSFSNAGKLPGGLGSFVLTSGPLAGWSVGQVLALANQVLGGCVTLPAFGLNSVSDLNDVVTSINEMFDAG